MNPPIKQIFRLRNMMPALALSLFYTNGAYAATDDFSFTDNIYNSAGILAGNAPWVDLQITDTTTAGQLPAGELQFTLSTSNLTGSQDVTGIYLNIPTGEARNVTGITISNPSNTSAQPLAFVSGSSSYSSSQNITTPATATLAGSFDLFLKFPVGTVTGTISETFILNFAGVSPTVADFMTASLPKSSGSPSFDAAASFTNATGIGGSGVSVVTAVPLPAAIWLFGSAVAGFVGFNRRKTA